MPDYMTVCEQAAAPPGRRCWSGWVSSASAKRAAPTWSRRPISPRRKPSGGSFWTPFPTTRCWAKRIARERAQRRTEYRWVADPLDGTTNYVHGVPHFAVSLALERNGVPLVGAVFDPMLESASRGCRRGLSVNGSRIHVSRGPTWARRSCAPAFRRAVKADSPELLVFIEAACGVRGCGGRARRR